ncbi:MAG: TIGR01777 family protein, partial [Planctomycetes bacterium]|nr:TIGR01777 family protein [Planctomycetota bacterium]
MPTLVRSSIMPAPVESLAAWHFRPGALERLVPPWENARVLQASGGIADGSTVTLRLKKGPMKVDWLARHEQVQPGSGFVDRQMKGPFAEWVHQHRFLPHDADRSTLEDHVTYRLPGGWLGAMLGGPIIRPDLERTFVWRHRRTANDLRRHRELSQG